MTPPSVSAIANWFGSSRMVADRIGPELDGLPVVVVPFAGGMAELPHISAAKLLVNDRHRHVVNLARVIADPIEGPQLYRRLRRLIFHPDTLATAQERLRGSEAWRDPVAHAEAYAIATWMGRGGSSGRRNEFSGSLPVRYSPNGGGSGQRFHNWVTSIPAWRRVLRRCEFTCDDAFSVLEKTHDSPRVGIYADPPWPAAGDDYTHVFSEDDQRRLADALARFTQTRVVVRFGDHPLIRELYPRDVWTWRTYPSRAQTNERFDEVLIVRGAA